MTDTTQRLLIRRYLWRVVEVIALLVFVSLVCLCFSVALPYLLPFVIGWFIAVLLLPLVRQLERRGVSRLVAVLTTMIAVGVLVILASTYAIIAIARETTTLTYNLPHYFNAVQAWFTHSLAAGKLFFGQLPPTVASGMESSAGHALTAIESRFQSFATVLLSAVTGLPEWTFIIVIGVIATFFMLVHRERMYRRFLAALPPGWQAKVRVVVSDMMRALAGTIRVQVVLMIMSAVLGILGLLVMHIGYAVLLGLLFGVTGMIPILGSAIVSVPWAAGALALGDVTLAVKILALQVVISLIRHMVEPKILADSVGLDTLSTLFALYVGMKLIGVWGLFLGPIILIGVKSLLRIRLFVDFLPDLGPDRAAVPKPAEGLPQTVRGEASDE